ncbi:hypothetical protein A6R68_24130, partial [Neotoma lepida]
QEALLAAISEKDANIALLELSASKKKKTQEEVMALKREKDRLVHQLKQQVGHPARKVYRSRKQPPCSNIPCTCDAGYSPDFTAKYHGSSYDAHMSLRSQVNKLIQKLEVEIISGHRSEPSGNKQRILETAVTQNRMKLMADNYDEDHHHYHHHHHHHHHRSPGRSQHSNHRPSPD